MREKVSDLYCTLVQQINAIQNKKAKKQKKKREKGERRRRRRRRRREGGIKKKESWAMESLRMSS